MKISIAALVVVLAATPAFAQQGAPSATDHQTHHPQAVQAQPATSAPSTPQPGRAMPGMQGGGMMGGMMSGTGSGMMSCPMMGGAMAGAMGQGGMVQGGMAMGQPPRGDQSVASLALGAVNQRMHREMTVEYTGNVDADFVRSMIAHHRGAVDMAKVVAAFGQDPKIRELAQAIIRTQEGEIATMQSWLSQNARP